MKKWIKVPINSLTPNDEFRLIDIPKRLCKLQASYSTSAWIYQYVGKLMFDEEVEIQVDTQEVFGTINPGVFYKMGQMYIKLDEVFTVGRLQYNSVAQDGSLQFFADYETVELEDEEETKS